MPEPTNANGSGEISPPASSSPAAPQVRRPSILFGPNGLRAGWRLFIYFALCTGIVGLIGIALHLAKVHQPSRPTVLDPVTELVSESGSFLIFALAAVVMARIEKEKWGHYGLPPGRAFRREFWLGALWGFTGLCLVMLCLWGAHFYAIEGLALHGWAIAKYGALWAAGMLFVGFLEEFLFRGYTLYTTASGMGFWPAAILWSVVFLLSHVANGGENWLGLCDVFLFGLFACLTLWKTGNLWFAVGVHAAWDWGLTFFYSAPDSGLNANGQLFHAHFSGPAWLSGGSAGPEGSAINVVFDLLWFVVFALLFREPRWLGMKDRRQAAAAPAPVVIDPSALQG